MQLSCRENGRIAKQLVSGIPKRIRRHCDGRQAEAGADRVRLRHRYPPVRDRVRLVGGDARALAEALSGSPSVAVYAGEVTASGRVELLPFLHEQAISITAHRFGNPDALSDAVI